MFITIVCKLGVKVFIREWLDFTTAVRAMRWCVLVLWPRVIGQGELVFSHFSPISSSPQILLRIRSTCHRTCSEGRGFRRELLFGSSRVGHCRLCLCKRCESNGPWSLILWSVHLRGWTRGCACRGHLLMEPVTTELITTRTMRMQ